jgi:hypothetical protein
MEKIRIRIRDEQLGSYFRDFRNNFLVKILKLFDADPGSGMPNSDPGSRINIPDPQHWIFGFFCLFEWQVLSFLKEYPPC